MAAGEGVVVSDAGAVGGSVSSPTPPGVARDVPPVGDELDRRVDAQETRAAGDEDAALSGAGRGASLGSCFWAR